MMRTKRKIWQQVIAIVLCIAMMISQVNIVNAKDNGEDTAAAELQTSKEQNISAQSDNTQETVPDQTDASGQSEEPETTEDITSYYKDGKICIYNYSQLQRIGTGYQVYTGDKDGNIGSGEVVKNEGTELTYSTDGQYLLMNDIEMNNDPIWTVADSFTGSITGENTGTDETPTLYDKASDTIYIYNPYQLMVLAQDDSENEPVMSMDYDASQFGMGQMIYPDGEDKAYLTYSKSHKYVLSTKFNSDKPKLVASQLQTTADTADTTDAEGRDFKGQVVKTIGDKTYILIGNAEQLRKIGSGDTVYGAVYQAYYHNAKWSVDKDKNGNPIMLYGGDADLTKEQNETDDYTFGEKGVHSADRGLSQYTSVITSRGRCGVTQSTGEIDPTLDIDKATGQTYSATANYIIFRDIDLSGENWTPLMFQGTMLGAKAENGIKIWNDDGNAFNKSEKPVLSNIKIEQTEKLNVGEQMGVGFFSTLSSETSADDIGVSKGLVKVSNLQFKNISVNTNTSETYYPSTLVSTLTSSLGKVLGGVLSGVTWLLTFGQVKVDLGKTLGDVLDARKKDPTALATGSLAGRIEGEVELSDIQEDGVKVINVNNNTGGLVGYTTGITQYSGLSNALGDLVKLLTNILNVIPGLGLGDLITILLGNAIPVDKLIPTGYINAKIINCNISNLSGTIGSSDKEYAGGLIGQQIGTIIENCNITNSNYIVKAKNFAGGFTGLSRDDVIEGTLSGALDIETKLPGMNPESMILNSSISGQKVSVAGEAYVGGFAGALANTSAVNDTVNITDTFTVDATDNNAGGFAGIATLGWSANLGKGDTKDNLLGGVVDLVVKLLSSNPGATTSLLSLAGINPSYILGCQITGPLQLSGSDYVGGITGRGDGAYIAESTEAYLNKCSYWKNGIYTTDQVTARPVSLNGLKEITGKNYVGGIAGSLGTASVAGLLNTTLGVASYLAFTVDTVNLTGEATGFKIEASGERIGGAVGEAIGGSMKNTTIANTGSIKGNNMVGGFIGLSGPGDLAGTDGGLTVNLLGLNYVLKLSNLLSLGQAVEVQIENASVSGVDAGFEVEETGTRTNDSVTDYTASGFIARSNSTKVTNAKVNALKTVTAADDGGYAGGFVAISKTGGLAEVGDETEVKSLIQTNGLLNAIGYLIPSYTACTVTYVAGGGVSGDTAGGFAGDFQSGTVNNQSAGEGNYYAVYNLDYVNGQSYAGGFGGKVYSGALADSSKGISILGGTGLNINLSDLLSVIDAYVPYVKYAGVKSDNGFTVKAMKVTTDTTVGSAGGFIGYASGAQISYSDVSKLKHTKVTTPDDLEGTSAVNYLDSSKSSYAVTGGRYAGGYVGDMDIGSAASVGGGLKVLGDSIELTGILSALSVVVTTIEHSDVTGGTGGYAILANGTKDGAVGMAGGYAGGIYGGHIQDSQAVNFSYIIGQIASGGYIGEMEPGDLAKLLDNASILGKLVNVDSTLASLLQSFVPTIRNSSTNCIPCGGAVRAQGTSDATVQRGMAGGYVGHNMGGTIHGLDTSTWKKEYAEGDTKKSYNGETSLCKVERIRSVYGQEYAGGYTGLMECADTAKVGGLKLLDGLISIDNILGALGVIYPAQTNTAVYGPLANLDKETWNSWVTYVGKYGGYGYELARTGTVNSDEELEQKLAEYTYGYNVVAGRSTYNNQLESAGGDAGGYVGLMNSGTLTNCMAYDTKLVRAMHGAGGYAGQMKSGGAAKLGTVSILGLDLNAGKLLSIAQLFVPAVRNSSVQGFTTGLTVEATGAESDDCGYAGGYAGCAYGAQIQLNGSDQLPGNQWKATKKYAVPETSCNATNLRRITGRKAVGGYVGLASAGSVAGVSTNASDGLLQGILDYLIKTPDNLATILQATATTIHSATVSAADSTWGFVVDGAYKDGNNVKYAPYAGGFAGSLEASAVGENNATDNHIKVQNLRRVDAGKYAGGFFGLADVEGVAEVSGTDPDGKETKLLSGLIKLGNTSVLDAFRTYINHASVDGIAEGTIIEAHENSKEGNKSETRYSGCAGGFGGGMMDGTVKESQASNVGTVTGPNYTGGFIGHLGKSGVADIDDVSVLDKLLNGTVGALDLFGAHIENCTMTGASYGTVVKATGSEEPVAGGFIGYGDLAKVSGCSATALKKVTSGQIAGGFIGRTDMNYIVSTELQSNLLNTILVIVNKLLSILYVGDLQNLGVIDVNLGPILKLQVLSKGNTLYVELLGIQIGVALNKKTGDGQSDVAVISIGDSTIELPCTENGVNKDDIPNVKINLIKGNRTVVEKSSVTGISSGYDVYGGGATDTSDGINDNGISGGFVGLNHEGRLENNTMTLCDVVRGTENKVGPFTGVNDLKSVYSFNTIQSIEGTNNKYSIYRTFNTLLSRAVTAGNSLIGTGDKDETTGRNYNRYEVKHLDAVKGLDDLKDAVMEDDKGDNQQKLEAYASPAKAVLMLDMANADTPDSTTSEPADQADPCRKSVDLTIQKIWKDFMNIDKLRPDKIEVKIYQQKFDTNGTASGEPILYKTVEMSTEDQETGSTATWRKVIKDAPVAQYKTETDGTVTNEIEYYYTYSFKETEVPGYETTVEYNEKTYQATITNKHFPKLPFTGGDGRNLIYLIGILLLTIYLAMRYKKHKENQEEDQKAEQL